VKRRNRVLVLNERDPTHPKAGGAEVHIVEIFSRLAAKGYEITLATSTQAGAAPRDEMHGLSVWRLGPLPFYYPRAAWTCARETRAGRFDIVVECLNKLPFFSPVYSSVPVLALCHHLFGSVAFQQVAWPVAAAVWTAERLIPPLYRKPPFITISESSRADLIDRGIPAERIRVSHCGAQHPSVAPKVDTARPRRLAYVGRVEPYKRIDVMLRAAASLRERFPDLEVVVIGRGGALPGLQSLARELGIEGRTRFTGFVSNQERDALLAESRVCICASEKEGWGLTVIEANVLGTPVVATDTDGLRDSVRDGETGFLVASGDVNGFADRSARLLADDALAVRMSRAALEWSRGFDWDRSTEDMQEAMADALAIG